jgi:hypothetical protein
MTQYNLSAKYIIQANHMTIDYHYHYNDTQNYLLYGDNATSTTVRAFSISGRYGAYCDYSQNYKILVGSGTVRVRVWCLLTRVFARLSEHVFYSMLY